MVLTAGSADSCLQSASN